MKRLLILWLALLAAPASAQLVTATLPTTCNAAQTACVRSTPVTNPDGTSIGGGAVTGLVGVKGTDGTTISGPTNGVSVLGTKLNDGTQSSTAGTHLTIGGVDAATNVYRPMLVDPSGRVQVGQGALITSGKTAVTGTFTATGQSAAFTPIAGRAMNVTISSGVAVCQVERSFDSGSTWFVEISDAIRTAIPESFTVNEAEVGTQVRINCTGYTSGTVTYRLSM